MPVHNASIFELVQAISSVLPNLTSDGSPLSNNAREDLILNAERLAIAAREPHENLYYQATQVRLSCEQQQ